MPDKSNSLKIDWASHEAAKYACENWHYSGCLPSGKLVKIGVWEHDKFVGVVLFGRGASPFLGRKWNLQQDEICELVRVALRAHSAPVTRIVKIALKLLKKSNPGLKLVVSFADPKEGHHGGIYQGGNWIYTGQSNKTTEVFVKGKWTHMRGAFYQMNKNTKTRTVPGKHRYVMPLDPHYKKALEQIAQPYPKRAPEA